MQKYRGYIISWTDDTPKKRWQTGVITAQTTGGPKPTPGKPCKGECRQYGFFRAHDTYDHGNKNPGKPVEDQLRQAIDRHLNEKH